jgi:hypothetical protein
MKCPSCGQGFHGVNSPSSFNSAPATQATQIKSSGQSIGTQTVGTPSSHSGVGIGGWLLLPAIFLPIGILYRLFAFLDAMKPILISGVFSELFVPGSSTYHPMNAVVIGYELIFNIFIFVFAVRVTYLFYKKSASLPKLYIYLLVFLLLGTLLNLILASQLPIFKFDDKHAKDVIGLVGSLIIWGLYFTKSKRVKQTFVN